MCASSGKTAATRLSSITTLWPCPVGSRFLLPRKEGSGAGTRTLYPLDRAEMAQAAQSVHQRYPRRRPRRACGFAIKGAPAGCRPPDDPLQFPQAPIVRCGGLAGQRPAAGPVASPWRRDRSAIAHRAARPRSGRSQMDIPTRLHLMRLATDRGLAQRADPPLAHLLPL